LATDAQWPFFCAREAAALPAVELAATHAEHCRALGERALSREDYLHQAQSLVACLRRRWSQHSVSDGSDVDSLVQRLGLQQAQRSDMRAPHLASALPSLQDLARLAADHEPAVGQDGPDTLYGSFSEELNVRRPEQRYAALAAMGLMGFVDVDAVKRSPVHRYMRSCTCVQQRAALRAIAWAPVSICRVEAIDEQGLSLTDLLQIAAPYRPQHAVAHSCVGGLLGPLQCGDVLVARLVPREGGGFTACMAVSAGAAPQQGLVRMWLDCLWLMARLSDRRVTAEAVLRYAWVPLVRRLFEWSYQRQAGMDEPKGLR